MKRKLQAVINRLSDDKGMLKRALNDYYNEREEAELDFEPISDTLFSAFAHLFTVFGWAPCSQFTTCLVCADEYPHVIMKTMIIKYFTVISFMFLEYFIFFN